MPKQPYRTLRQFNNAAIEVDEWIDAQTVRPISRRELAATRNPIQYKEGKYVFQAQGKEAKSKTKGRRRKQR